MIDLPNPWTGETSPAPARAAVPKPPPAPPAMLTLPPPSLDNRPQTRLEQVRYALRCARTARDWLREAGADNAARYQARAIKSIEGAERHAIRMENAR